MPLRHRHRVGRHLMEDEESGIVTYDDKIVKRWDGALVRRKAFETRQPQEFVRAKSDPKALKDIRPAQEAPQVSLGPALRVGTTNVPAPKGIGYRLTRTGIGTMRIGGSFVVDGEFDDVSVSASPLKFNPNVVVPLTNPTTYNITTQTTATRTVHLAANEHAIVQLASGASNITGMCRIIGEGDDSRVWVIGGAIKNEYSEGITGTDHKCLDISNVKYAYLEGVRLDKGVSLGDALTVRGSARVGPTVYIQNSLLLGGQTSAAGMHGDALQIQAQIMGLHMYNVTMTGPSHVYLTNSNLNDQFVSGATIVSGATFDRVNGILTPRASNQPHSADTFHVYFMQDDCSMKKIRYTLSEVYAHDEEPGGLKVGSLCRPGPQGSSLAANACGSYETWDTCYWDSSTLITGEVRQGLPPGGNFVPLNFSGIGYVSPGYRS
jgi:hypothetical protein